MNQDEKGLVDSLRDLLGGEKVPETLAQKKRAVRDRDTGVEEVERIR